MDRGKSGAVVLITGGSGFLGHALVQELLKDSEHGGVLPVRELRIYDRCAGGHRDEPRVVCIEGDIRSLDSLRHAFRDVDAVFHCAAVVDWGRQPDRLLEEVNVEGTDNVIQACCDAGVETLVHTSTLDVVYTGKPIVDGDETLPYPEHHVDTYGRTKAQAERRVIAANNRPLSRGVVTDDRKPPKATVTDDGKPQQGSEPQSPHLRTVVIRPCSIFGERDPYHVAPLVRMARKGLLVRIGDGTARSQFVYVGNVAHAMVLAARNLLLGPGNAAGQVYFITDGAPANFFDFLAPFVEATGTAMPSWSRRVPRKPMLALGAALEGSARLLRPLVSFQPTITRFAVDYVTLDFTFRSDKAARELGYEPCYGEAEAIERTKAYFRELYSR